MASLFRPNTALLASFGTGLIIGVGGTTAYFRFLSMVRVVDELERITKAIAELRSEVQDLREKIPTRKRRSPGGYYSTATSSGETDDEAYEDAYGGSSDFENLNDEQTELHTKINSDIAPTPQVEKEIFPEVDILLEGRDEDKFKAYQLLDSNRIKFEKDVEFYWRLAKTSYQVSQIEGARGNKERQKELVYAAMDAATKAVDIDEACANAHKWYAITLGSIGDYEGTQAKIKNGYTFKEHIERAIELNPTDPSNHHLLGRWCYGVYMLSWIERKAAATLYAAPPSSTADEALKHFLEAERLRPEKWKENILFIGKCYIQQSKYKEAVEWLEKGQAIPVISQDDKTSQEEIQSLLQKYRGY
ncbi:hypothetical protein FSP39_013102 [Pinctada imbricata]|uniref:Regulator of microtubule dynamics protein 1 n=1 Tax=Pinctada imbricata TaxID=66713 RepID=A0AA88XVI7_PINIB|nr:hypothetical protein FSP39_013102 [Pinctada imbricata]